MIAHDHELLGDSTRTGLVIVAHPDDETIGAAALMTRMRTCRLLHVTDGAPRDTRFMSPTFVGTRAEYVRLRRRELLQALRLAGMEPSAVLGLGIVDLDVALAMDALAHYLAHTLSVLRPDFVVTHAYEGGHPDHDAIAFATWAAMHLLARRGLARPVHYELALYHGAGGFHAGEFLPGTGGAELEWLLSAAELERKQAMLRCHASQSHVIDAFLGLRSERFRRAPSYDFTRPPHDGPLHYEQIGFTMTGAAWCSLAVQALRTLELPGGVAA